MAVAAEGEAEFRPSIRDAVIGANRQDSVLGPFALDEEGDTSQCTVQRFRVGELSVDPEAAFCAE